MKDLHQLLNSGQSEAALALLEGRMASAPHDPGLALLKGVALFQTGAVGEAEQAFQLALGLGLHAVAQARKNLASICFRDRRFQKAADFIEQYRQEDPRAREPLALHVAALAELGRFADAEREIGKYLEVFPDDSEVLSDLLFCLGLQGRYLELLAYTGRLPSTVWQNPKIVRSIAGALAAVGLPQIARDVTAAAMDADTESAEGQRMFRYLGAQRALEEHRFEEAIELYQTSINGSEDANAGLFNLSLACLAAGRLGEGWRLMRARTTLFSMATLSGVPRWDGQPIANKRLLVHAEQGIGDVIQFIRYLPMLEQAGGSIVFNAYPEILRLLGNDPRARATPSHDVDLTKLQFDYQAQLLDLPSMLGTESVLDIPANTPYLYANKDSLAFWRDRLAEYAGMKIGLVWAGNPKHKQDHHRSAQLVDFEPLMALPGVTWVLLQKGEGASEAKALEESSAFVCLSSEIESFDDTAAIIECLDLVISVDTSVAHLAGALNRPVWILLAESGKDWRWFLGADKSPWYPSATLYTRARETGWSDFIRGTVRPALAAWLSDHLPASREWANVRSAIKCLSGGGAEIIDAAAWVDGFRRLELNLLPLARTLMLERQEVQPLKALVAECGGDASVVSAWAESLLHHGDRQEAFALWDSLRKTGQDIPASGYLAWGAGLHEQARYAEARDVWDSALVVFPDHAQLRYMAGRTAQWAGQREAAIPFYERALELSPRHPQAHNNRGVLHEADAPFLALAAYQRAAMNDVGYAKPWQNMVRVLVRLNAAKVAVLIMRQRCDVNASAGARAAFARALVESGELDEAENVLKMIESDGQEVDQDVLIDMAFAFRGLEDLARCRATLRRLAESFPECRPGQMFLGWQLLAEGECSEGWPHYIAGCDSKVTTIPEWRGEVLSGKSLLVFQDQGMGDLFQFAHLVCKLPRDAEVTLAVCDPALVLLSDQGWPCRVVSVSTVDWQSDRYDFQIAQMKLQNLLKIDLVHPPCAVPYIRAPVGLLPQWEQDCALDQRLKVGIVWAGNPKYLNDFRRSTRLRDWLPLFELEGVGIYNLQKDIASNQAWAWSELALSNIAADCDSWEKTANALMLLDMVISVDTGVAHLAACLGKPTWILLPNRGTDFRWLLKREDVPWYPQARLFRQSPTESWSDVLLRVKEQLANDLPALRR